MDVNALAREVQEAWDEQFTSAPDSALDYRMAVAAVEAVLGAIAAQVVTKTEEESGNGD